MIRIPYLRGSVVAGAMAAALLAVPSAGQSQVVVGLPSTAYATCVVANCSVIRLGINLQGNWYLNKVHIRSLDASKWQFAGLIDSRDRYGNALNWSPFVTSTDIKLNTGGTYEAEPLYLTIANRTYSTNPGDGSIRYLVRGTLGPNGSGTVVETWGTATATPEPASLLLLGTGLVGVVGAARRRMKMSRQDEV